MVVTVTGGRGPGPSRVSCSVVEGEGLVPRVDGIGVVVLEHAAFVQGEGGVAVIVVEGLAVVEVKRFIDRASSKDSGEHCSFIHTHDEVIKMLLSR